MFRVLHFTFTFYIFFFLLHIQLYITSVDTMLLYIPLSFFIDYNVRLVIQDNYYVTILIINFIIANFLLIVLFLKCHTFFSCISPSIHFLQTSLYKLKIPTKKWTKISFFLIFSKNRALSGIFFYILLINKSFLYFFLDFNIFVK